MTPVIWVYAPEEKPRSLMDLEDECSFGTTISYNHAIADSEGGPESGYPTLARFSWHICADMSAPYLILQLNYWVTLPFIPWYP